MNLAFKHLIYCTLTFFLSISIFAQEPITHNIEFGTVFKNENREIPVDIIGSDDNGYYILYSEGKFGQGDEMKIRRFNLDLTPSNEEINLKNNPIEGDFNSLGVTKLKDRIIHVFYILNGEGKHYFRQTIDLDNFQVGNTETITVIENDTKSASNSVSRFLISDNEEIITMFYTIPNKNREYAKIKIQTFDFNFKPLNENEYEFPYQNNQFSIYRVASTKENGVILLCKKYNSSNVVREENNQGYEFQVYKIENQTMNKITSIQPKGFHLRYLNTKFDNNNMILSGLFSKENIYDMTGVYYSKVNLENGQLQNEEYNKFDASFMTMLIEEGNKKDRITRKFEEGKHEDPNYVIANTLLMPNGDLVVLAEQRRSITSNYTTTFYHENIAIMKLGVDGKLIWANKIGKNNVKSNVSIYNSFLSISKDENIYLLYNCNVDNLNHKTGNVSQSFSTYNRAFITAKIDTNGNYNREVLINKESDEGITIRPMLYNWIDKNTLLLFGQDIDNLKNQRFVKLKF